jgi:hypothetical protein
MTEAAARAGAALCRTLLDELFEASEIVRLR